MPSPSESCFLANTGKLRDTPPLEAGRILFEALQAQVSKGAIMVSTRGSMLVLIRQFGSLGVRL